MIDQCVRCGYSLKGLPEVHRCPECGHENDRESTAIREPRVFAKLNAVAGVVVFLAVTARAWVRGVASLSHPMVALAVALIAAAWIQVRRRARTIVVSRRSLELIDEASKVKSYTMEDVADAHWSFATGRTRITDRKGRVVVIIPNKFFNSLRADRKVVQAIKAVVAQRDAIADPQPDRFDGRTPPTT